MNSITFLCAWLLFEYIFHFLRIIDRDGSDVGRGTTRTRRQVQMIVDTLWCHQGQRGVTNCQLTVDLPSTDLNLRDCISNSVSVVTPTSPPPAGHIQSCTRLTFHRKYVFFQKSFTGTFSWQRPLVSPFVVFDNNSTVISLHFTGGHPNTFSMVKTKGNFFRPVDFFPVSWSAVPPWPCIHVKFTCLVSYKDILTQYGLSKHMDGGKIRNSDLPQDSTVHLWEATFLSRSPGYIPVFKHCFLKACSVVVIF